MTKVWIGDYVSFDAETQDMVLLPLLECLRYAIRPDRPADFFLKSLLGEDGPGGGDPGWSIHWIPKESEALFPDAWGLCMSGLPGEGGCYEAWTNQEISDLDPPCAYYSKLVVYRHVREVLENFRLGNPKREREVDSIIKRFEFQGA